MELKSIYKGLHGITLFTPNRTIVELKFWYDKHQALAQQGSQSYHRGIEMTMMIRLEQTQYPPNRTIVELKCK